MFIKQQAQVKVNYRLVCDKASSEYRVSSKFGQCEMTQNFCFSILRRNCDKFNGIRNMQFPGIPWNFTEVEFRGTVQVPYAGFLQVSRRLSYPGFQILALGSIMCPV
jgi:hypothetical protein